MSDWLSLEPSCGVVLRAGLFAAILAVLGILLVRFGIDLGLRQIERRQ